jgi:DNA-binding LacI/PurR family transcriptional regulator
LRSLSARLLRDLRKLTSSHPVRLPGERALAEQYGVNRHTMRVALVELERLGVITRRPRSRTWTCPDRLARMPAVPTTKTLLWWQPRHKSGAWTDMLESVVRTASRRARQLGYRLAVVQAQSGVRLPRADLRPPPAQYDGIIVEAIIDPAFLQSQLDAGVPVVAVDVWTEDDLVDCVAVQCDAEGMMLARVLLEAHHRHIGYMVDLKADGFSQRVVDPDAYRVLGGMQVAAQLAAAPTRFWVRDDVTDLPEDVARAWLSLPECDRPTAMVFFTAGHVDRFLAVLAQAGYRCPDDISVVTREGRPTDSKVTRVLSDFERTGSLAVELLDQRISGLRNDVVKAAIPTRLVRGTTVKSLR